MRMPRTLHPYVGYWDSSLWMPSGPTQRDAPHQQTPQISGNRHAPNSHSSRSSCFHFTMNPYVSNPDNIPSIDSYADVPFYGRYFPREDDFRVDLQHANSQSVTALQYWASVVDRCDESVKIYPADEGGRDVLVLNSVIIKSSHLHSQ